MAYSLWLIARTIVYDYDYVYVDVDVNVDVNEVSELYAICQWLNTRLYAR
jgi:hypothetical protein